MLTRPHPAAATAPSPSPRLHKGLQAHCRFHSCHRRRSGYSLARHIVPQVPSVARRSVRRVIPRCSRPTPAACRPPPAARRRVPSAEMEPLSPSLRHQSFLESIINLSSSQPAPLEASLRAQAQDRFYHIVGHFETAATRDDYSRPMLVRLTYEYSRSEESKDMFLRAFFDVMGLSMDSHDGIDLADSITETHVSSALFNFADHLFNYFFMPCKSLSLSPSKSLLTSTYR